MGRVCSLGDGGGCSIGVASDACPARGEGGGIGVGVKPSRSMSKSKSRTVDGVNMIGEMLAGGLGKLCSGLESSESILGGMYSGRLGICSRSSMCAGRVVPGMLRRVEGFLLGV
jgi:hypothetical protein